MHIVFDLDDTLVRLKVDWQKVKEEINTLAKTYGEGFYINSLYDIALFEEFYKLNRDKINFIYRKYEEENIDEAEPLPLLETVKSLKRKTYSIFTNNTHKTAEYICDKFGLEPLVIMARDDVEMPKPYGEGLMKIKEKVDDYIIFVGDHITDFLAGMDAGINTFLLNQEAKDFKKLLEYLL